MLCQACFDGTSENSTSRTVDTLGSDTVFNYAAPVEDYVHTPYLTRRMVASTKLEDHELGSLELVSYGPQNHQLFSLPFLTTYFDIPGRAPRCTLFIYLS